MAVIVAGRHYQTASQSRPGLTYRLDRTRAGWQCACDGYRFTGCCKHLAQLARRAEREGWDFGRIVPPTPDHEPTPPAGALDLAATRARKRRALADRYGDAA